MQANFAHWRARAETKARYGRCLDMKGWDGYGDCFNDSSVLDTTSAGSYGVEAGSGQAGSGTREGLDAEHP